MVAPFPTVPIKMMRALMMCLNEGGSGADILGSVEWFSLLDGLENYL